MCIAVAGTVVADVMSSTFSKARRKFTHIKKIKKNVPLHVQWFGDMYGPLGRFTLAPANRRHTAGTPLFGSI